MSVLWWRNKPSVAVQTLQKVDTILSTVADLQTAVTTLQASVDALPARIAGSGLPAGSVAIDQTVLDSLVSGVTTASTALDAIAPTAPAT